MATKPPTRVPIIINQPGFRSHCSHDWVNMLVISSLQLHELHSATPADQAVRSHEKVSRNATHVALRGPSAKALQVGLELRWVLTLNYNTTAASICKVVDKCDKLRQEI